MKPILLSSKSSHQDLLTYGNDLFNKIITEYKGVAYDQFKPDFSDVPELFDEDEKLVMFNHFALPDGFAGFSKYLPTFKNIKYVLSPYSSYSGLDLELVKKLGISYRNNGGANAKSVAQYAVFSMFSLLTRFPILSKLESIPDGTVLGEEYHDKTAGIIGMGNVGQEILSTLTGLGIQTVYFNRTKKDVNASLVSLVDIFKQDIIFISIASNPETIELLGNVSALMQKHNYIVDISAIDALYDKKKVFDLLNHNQIKGYAVEFFKSVPADFVSEKNLIATPHIAWCTTDAEKRTVENFLNRALTILDGKPQNVDFTV